MISEKLKQARGYEAAHGADILPEERPLFHVTPTVGWLNDPNGFSLYRGEYHLFYQYHPYGTVWGPMHWGHCKSRDLLRWERLPAALAPDQDYDRDGCFSGSAVELDDGRQLLLYTGVREVREDGAVQVFQTQCAAVGDGVDYEKCPSNPVITGDALPAGGSTADFRDPKLWREGETWYAVVGNRTEDGSGAVLLYTSEDAVRWELAGTLDRSRNEYGRMWECPDLFDLDGQSVLLVSPQEMEARGLEFRNGNEVLCILGDCDRGTRAFTRRAVLPVDQGLDFYAPQTLLTPDGRRVMIGWMQAWEASKFVPAGQKWFGMLSLPRELRVRDGRLIQTPVRELEACRGEGLRRELLVTQAMTLPGISGRVLDLTVALRPVPGKPFTGFTLHLAQDETHRTSLHYTPEQNLLTLDRTHAGFARNIAHIRTVAVRPRQGALTLRVILDRFSVEAFVNGGEQVLSATIYTPQSADGISFEAEGVCQMDLEKYELSL